jgi:hypothetical protein
MAAARIAAARIALALYPRLESEQSNYQIPSNDKPFITTLPPVSPATVFQSLSAGWQGDPKPTIAE